MDILDIPSDSASYDSSWLFPQPLSVCQRYSSGMFFSAKAEPNPERLCWFKRGDNHLQVYRAQCLLNRYIGILRAGMVDERRPSLAVPSGRWDAPVRH